MSHAPQILFIGGHDPSGGAGIQADIETAQAHGCQAFSLVTCLTTQDSSNIRALHPQEEATFEAQLDCLLQDVTPEVVKIGLIGSPGIARLLGERIADFPLVLDPVLAAGGGQDLADEALIAGIHSGLLPAVTLLTPNRAEARRLANQADTDRAAQQLLDAGCDHLLLTGADEAESGRVRHRLLDSRGARDFEQPLLPNHYHGSGCTLASASACNLALGLPLETAVEQALDRTWQTLQQATRPGKGQYLPKRRIPLP